MARFFIRFLAIYNFEYGPKSIKIRRSRKKIGQTLNMPLKKTKGFLNFPKWAKFCQIWSHFVNTFLPCTYKRFSGAKVERFGLWNTPRLESCQISPRRMTEKEHFMSLTCSNFWANFFILFLYVHHSWGCKIVLKWPFLSLFRSSTPTWVFVLARFKPLFIVSCLQCDQICQFIGLWASF